MTENKEKQDDKDKEKDMNKDYERNVLRHFVDVGGLNSHEMSHETSAITSSGGTTTAMVAAAATSAVVLGDEIRSTIYMTQCASFQSEILTIEVDSGELLTIDRQQPQTKLSSKEDSLGTQRVYKKTSPNSTITLYLPTREIILFGSKSTVLRGIVFVDPKAVQGYRIYAQLTLTFRYGREDEEVMGLRFCNEAIMSLHQVWPRAEEPSRESLSPLQDALLKRLGEGAHPFTLNLTPQAPPSVQLVPAKRYYGAPIGTSYDVRCFIADKTEEKFHRRASVKMGVRVIYRTDVYHGSAPENYAALINNQASPPVSTDQILSPPLRGDSYQHQLQSQQNIPSDTKQTPPYKNPTGDSKTTTSSCLINTMTSFATNNKSLKSERGDSFPKLRLSPKSFRFSGRFGRSKSEIEKCPNDPFYNYSKSFQEYESGGPQGAVAKPFLLQEGRVSLRASLDKSWYTHGEDVIVNVNIRNDSRKTVRKVRVCAIQHVDVCMFNNGKFKNIVADSDNNSPVDRTVSAGGTLTTTFILKPQRGPTKNWIALEDTLQRSTEPEEITGAIAASAICSPSAAPLSTIIPLNQDDRNVFAIYVSYYVKVKLTLSGMGGELSLKLPFVLVHVDELYHKPRCSVSQELFHDIHKLDLDNVPPPRKRHPNHALKVMLTHEALREEEPSINRIESVVDELNITEVIPQLDNGKRKLLRSETVAKDISGDVDELEKGEDQIQDAQDRINSTKDDLNNRDDIHQGSSDDQEDNEEESKKEEETQPSHKQIIFAQVHSEV